VKSPMTMSVEIQRALHAIMRQKPDVHDIRVIVNPEVLNRLKTEDEELLVDIERKYSGRLTFRTDPTFHHEKYLILDGTNNQELKT
jgi:ribonuclease G